MPLEFWGVIKANTTKIITHLYFEACWTIAGRRWRVIVLSATPFMRKVVSSGWTHPNRNRRIWSPRHKIWSNYHHHGVVKMGSIRQGQSSEARVVAFGTRHECQNHLRHRTLLRRPSWASGTGVTQKGHWSIVRCCVLTSMTKPWLSKILSPLKTSLTNKSCQPTCHCRNVLRHDASARDKGDGTVWWKYGTRFAYCRWVHCR